MKRRRPIPQPPSTPPTPTLLKTLVSNSKPTSNSSKKPRILIKTPQTPPPTTPISPKWVPLNIAKSELSCSYLPNWPNLQVEANHPSSVHWRHWIPPHLPQTPSKRRRCLPHSSEPVGGECQVGFIGFSQCGYFSERNVGGVQGFGFEVCGIGTIFGWCKGA
ncbi:hypothetical protein AAG906_030259 [Vitis piasezkii]